MPAVKQTLMGNFDENKKLIVQKISETGALGNISDAVPNEINGSEDNE